MKKTLLTIISFIGVIVSTLVLVACNNEPVILDSIQNDYGVIIEGGKFEEGSTLVTNSVDQLSDEAKDVLDILSNQEYNKKGNVYIFDIYVSKDDKKIQPDGKIKVTIPVPEFVNENCFVFHIKENKSVEKIIPTFLESKIIQAFCSSRFFIAYNLCKTSSLSARHEKPYMVSVGIAIILFSFNVFTISSMFSFCIVFISTYFKNNIILLIKKPHMSNKTMWL